jgi:predicted tellurium resistance membrane protein TerC
VALIADGMGQHIPKGYIYFAMGFSVLVEMLNLRLRKKQTAQPNRQNSAASNLPPRAARILREG